MIRVTDVDLPDLAHDYVTEVLASGQLATGRFVERLEALAGEWCGTECVAVSNGTAALALALRIAGVQEGDRVVIPALTFAGTANAVIAVGAIPVCADVGPDRLIDPDHALAVAEKHGARVVVPVHLYGHPVDLEPFHGLTVVEDAAQFIGGPVGFGAISLYGSKTVPAGEGGLLVTEDTEWARVYRNQGMLTRYEHVMAGENLRLSNLAAAVACGVLENLDEILARRRANAARLLERLEGLPGLPPSEGVWHQFVVEVEDRELVAKRMRGFGVETAVHYPTALTDLPWIPDADTPNARRFASTVLSLPVHEHLTTLEVDRVADAFLWSL